MTIHDAHVHMGYFPRRGAETPCYYSPRRIFGALSRAGVDEFVVSSTDGVWDATGEVQHTEAFEMRRIAGARAHLFFWVSGVYLKSDPELRHLPEGLYEGFKLHGHETPWLQKTDELRRVLAIAQERGFKVQLHTGKPGDPDPNSLSAYLPFCKEFHNVRFDLAHGSPEEEINMVLSETDNVWIDTAFVPYRTVMRWLSHGADARRILFGTDIPAPQRWRTKSITKWVRDEAANFASDRILRENFLDFVRKP